MELCRPVARRSLSAPHALIECRGKAQTGEDPDLQCDQRLGRGAPGIKRLEKSHRGLEDLTLGFVIRQALPDRCKRGSRCADGIEASQDAQERAVDRYALEVLKLASPCTQVSVEHDARLERTTESALALARTTRQCGKLAEVFGEQRDYAIGVPVVDRSQEQRSALSDSS